MKKVVVNFAKGGWYPRGQDRLRKSLDGSGVDFIGIKNPSDVGAPEHSVTPYAFKTFCLNHCKRLGYEQAIYADSSIWAEKPWDPIWEKITEQGYYFEEAGHWTGTWTTDTALARLGITRDQAMRIPMFSAGFVGLDFRNDIAKKFLEEWHKYAVDGECFRGSWDNSNNSCSSDPRCQGHRHDMSVGAILAHKLGMSLGRGGTLLAYIGPGYNTPPESAVAYLQPCL